MGITTALIAGMLQATAPACDTPVYMVVAGPTRDRERMMAYGQAIAESQIYERLGGYYINAPRAVATFEGDAPAGYATLIVRFPCLANAEAFWNSDVYQNDILPLRQNPSAGDYFVTVYPEIPLRPDMVGKVGEADYLVRFEGTAIPDRQTYNDPAGVVLGGDAETAERADPGGGWPDAALLRRDAETGEAWRISTGDARTVSIAAAPALTELYVIRGGMNFGSNRIATGDYVRIGAGHGLGDVEIDAGTRLLMFRYPAGVDASPQPEPLIVRAVDTEWTAGTVALEAGAEAPLMIRRLFTDPETGARTHLVRLAAGVSVPWEIHTTAEEGYLLDGDYRLAECLPSGRRDFAYQPGGYFYRPAGILHSGPDSTTTTGATWLIRTPRTLDALFYPACPSAAAALDADEEDN